LRQLWEEMRKRMQGFHKLSSLANVVLHEMLYCSMQQLR